MNSAPLAIENNVTIRTVNKYGKTVRITHAHNKATKSLVKGILRFLSGEFNPTTYNPNLANVNINGASPYIPIKLGFGIEGVSFSDRATDQPKLSGVSSVSPTTFNTTSLFVPIDMKVFPSPFKFDSTREIPFAGSDSLGLSLTAYVSPGKLVSKPNGDTDRTYYIDQTVGTDEGWVYYDFFENKYAALFTEIGLYSGNDTLLARIALTGEVTVDSSTGHPTVEDPAGDYNPVIQDDDSSLIIEWKIGLISVDDNYQSGT